jgi:hypothetical protein
MKRLIFSAALMAALGFYACTGEEAHSTCITCEIAQTKAQVCPSDNGHVWDGKTDTGLTPQQFIDTYCENGNPPKPTACVTCAAYRVNDTDYKAQEVCESALGVAIVDNVNVGIDYNEYIAAVQNFTKCSRL